MIRVNEDYIIEVDNYGYTARLDTHTTRVDKNGNEIHVYRLVGYFGTLETALKGILKHKADTKLMGGEWTLKDAVNVIVAEQRKFNELLEKIMEG